MDQQQHTKSTMAGFSLIEMLIAMTVTIVLLGAAVTLLAEGFKIRTRADSMSDAAADAQRALNIMSREIANAGFNLTTNGVVAGDSDLTHLRIRSNLNRYDTSVSSASRNGVVDAGEDLKYYVNDAENTDYLVRYDVNVPETPSSRPRTVLANRLSSLRFHYFAQKVTYSTGSTSTTNCDISNPSAAEVTPDLASYIVIAVCVQLPAVGVPNQPGYQPAGFPMMLVSDVSLRNGNLNDY
jgi:Tfp pilus assembly protein PilW